MASILPVFVPHEGCPCRCVFCNQNTIAGQTVPMTPELADRILRDGLARLPEESRPQAAFYGGSFTAIAEELQESLLAVTDDLLEQGRLSSVRISTRPDAVSEDILRRMKRHRVTTVELGAQSMSDEVLRLSGRGHTAADTVRAAKLVRQAGMQLIVQTMTGLPGDTRERTRQTARRVAALHPDGVRIYPVVVLPDTALQRLWNSGEYTALDPEEAAEWCADMLEEFQREKIRVIRVGLNPSEELHSSVCAGAYHPAMGELAYNALWYRRLKQRLEDGAAGTLCVPKRELSRAIGQKRRNLLRLQKEFPERAIRIVGCDENGPGG